MAIEAVIISGPRKGEFVTLPEGEELAPPSDVSDALNAALKELDAQLVSAIEETRAWRESLARESGGSIHG